MNDCCHFGRDNRSYRASQNQKWLVGKGQVHGFIPIFLWVHGAGWWGWWLCVCVCVGGGGLVCECVWGGGWWAVLRSNVSIIFTSFIHWPKRSFEINSKPILMKTKRIVVVFGLF